MAKNLSLSKVIFGSAFLLVTLSSCRGKGIGSVEMGQTKSENDFGTNSRENLEIENESFSSEQDETKDEIPWSPFPPKFWHPSSIPSIPSRMYLRPTLSQQGHIYSPDRLGLQGLQQEQLVPFKVHQKRQEQNPRGQLSNYISTSDTSGLKLRPMNFNLRGFSSGNGRHSAAFFSPISPRKRQILFRQCFFNPISCF